MNKIFSILFLALIFSIACAKSGTNRAVIAPVGPNIVVAELALPNLAKQALQLQSRIYFPFASDAIMPEASQEIEHNIEWLKSNPSAYIILEGHCDEIGDSEFNMELGDRRARIVKAYMIEHNIPAERVIMVVSYGKTRPLNVGHTVEDLRQNRRVEFVVR